MVQGMLLTGFAGSNNTQGKGISNLEAGGLKIGVAVHNCPTLVSLSLNLKRSHTYTLLGQTLGQTSVMYENV